VFLCFRRRNSQTIGDIPDSVFFMLQMTFAIITPGLKRFSSESQIRRRKHSFTRDFLVFLHKFVVVNNRSLGICFFSSQIRRREQPFTRDLLLTFRIARTGWK